MAGNETIRKLRSVPKNTLYGACPFHVYVFLAMCSWKKNRDLRLKQELLNLPQYKMIASAATRWGSTYDMVCRIVKQQQATSAVLAEDCKHWHRMPSDSEFSVLETIVSMLKPLSVLTDTLSGEKQVTILAILPVLRHIQKVLIVTEGESRLATEMKTVISNDLEGRNTSDEIQTLFSIASFLHRRSQDRHLQDKGRHVGNKR